MEKILKIWILVVLAFCGLTSQTMMAQDETLPRWARKGVADLNRDRSNLSYTMRVFHTHDQDLSRVIENKTLVLADYAQNDLGAIPQTIKISEETSDPNTYAVTYKSTDGMTHRFYAKLVDTAYEYDEFEETYYEYEYYQLYAVSAPDLIPEFDDFRITRKYGKYAVQLSLVPGLGQLYKGQEVKGLCIMGGEVALIGGAIYFELERAYCHRQYLKGEPGIANGTSSWHKKSKSWGTMRNISIGGAVALYIYNLIDAAHSNGIPQVVIDHRKQTGVSFLPFVDVEGSGLSVSMTF